MMTNERQIVKNGEPPYYIIASQKSRKTPSCFHIPTTSVHVPASELHADSSASGQGGVVIQQTVRAVAEINAFGVKLCQERSCAILPAFLDPQRDALLAVVSQSGSRYGMPVHIQRFLLVIFERQVVARSHNHAFADPLRDLKSAFAAFVAVAVVV